MRFGLAVLSLFLGCVGLAPDASAQEAPPPEIETPDRGSGLRANILDALREDVTDVQGLRRDVIFQVHRLAVLDDYALVAATPLAKDGDTIPDYEADRPCDLEILALLERAPEGWRVAQRDVGPCDYIWPTVFEQNPEYPVALLTFWEQMEADYGSIGVRRR